MFLNYWNISDWLIGCFVFDILLKNLGWSLYKLVVIKFVEIIFIKVLKVFWCYINYWN